MIDDYIRNGYNFSIGVIDRGPHEGWFKASLDNGITIIESIGETLEKAYEGLERKFPSFKQASEIEKIILSHFRKRKNESF